MFSIKTQVVSIVRLWLIVRPFTWFASSAGYMQQRAVVRNLTVDLITLIGHTDADGQTTPCCHSPAGCVDAVGGLQQWPAAAAAGHCTVIVHCGWSARSVPWLSVTSANVFTFVCLSVNKTTQELLIKSLQNVMEWLNIIHRDQSIIFWVILIDPRSDDAWMPPWFTRGNTQH